MGDHGPSSRTPALSVFVAVLLTVLLIGSLVAGPSANPQRSQSYLDWVTADVTARPTAAGIAQNHSTPRPTSAGSSGTVRDKPLPSAALPGLRDACRARAASTGAGVMLERVDVGSSVPPTATPRWSCVADRTLYVDGLTVSTPIDLGPRALQGSNVSMDAEPLTAALDKLRLRAVHADPLLSVDVCLSFYHTYTDVIPALFGLLRNGRVRALETKAPRVRDSFPESLKLPMVPIFRSRCHVFHLAATIFLLPFATNEPFDFSATDFSDGSMTAAFEGRLFVTQSPPGVTLRKSDADFESAERRRLVLEHDDAVCGCGAVAAAEAQPQVQMAPETLQRFFSKALANVLPVPRAAMARIWSGCGNDQYRVLVMLRSHSRFVGNPADVMRSLDQVEALCARAFYFDELPVLLQYYAVRSAHALYSQHGAGLTYINVMLGDPVPLAGQPPASSSPPPSAPSCRRAVVEMWFMGKHTRSLSVYERAAKSANMSYRLMQPHRAEFFDWGAGKVHRDATTHNKSNGTALMTVPLPQGAILETDAAKNNQRAKAMRKRSMPHAEQDFLTQLAYFDPGHLRLTAEWLLKNLQDGCPLTTLLG